MEIDVNNDHFTFDQNRTLKCKTLVGLWMWWSNKECYYVSINVWVMQDEQIFRSTCMSILKLWNYK